MWYHAYWSLISSAIQFTHDDVETQEIYLNYSSLGAFSVQHTLNSTRVKLSSNSFCYDASGYHTNTIFYYNACWGTFLKSRKIVQELSGNKIESRENFEQASIWNS